MADEHHAMYAHLFRAVTQAVSVLQDAQIETEDMFVSARNGGVDAKRLAFELLKETLGGELNEG